MVNKRRMDHKNKRLMNIVYTTSTSSTRQDLLLSQEIRNSFNSSHVSKEESLQSRVLPEESQCLTTTTIEINDLLMPKLVVTSDRSSSL